MVTVSAEAKNIHRCAFADLLQEGAGAGEIEVDFGVGVFGLIGLGDVAEGIGEAGGAETVMSAAKAPWAMVAARTVRMSFFHGVLQVG